MDLDRKLELDLKKVKVDGSSEDSLLSRLTTVLEASPEIQEPAPKSVPGVLGMTPREFMTVPLERFCEIAGDTNYRKVTSSLNYIQNFSGKGITEVQDRVQSVRVALREWRALGSQEAL